MCICFVNFSSLCLSHKSIWTSIVFFSLFFLLFLILYRSSVLPFMVSVYLYSTVYTLTYCHRFCISLSNHFCFQSFLPMEFIQQNTQNSNNKELKPVSLLCPCELNTCLLCKTETNPKEKKILSVYRLEFLIVSKVTETFIIHIENG